MGFEVHLLIEGSLRAFYVKEGPLKIYCSEREKTFKGVIWVLKYIF